MRFWHGFIVWMLVLVLALCVVVAVGAQGPEEPGEDAPPALVVGELPPDLPGLLEVLACGGGGAAIGVLLSFLFEEAPAFGALSGQGKRWVSFGLSVGAPVAATLLLLYVPPEVWAQLQPLWMALVTGLMGWLGNQGAFRVLIEGRGERVKG